MAIVQSECLPTFEEGQKETMKKKVKIARRDLCNDIS